MHGKQRRSKYQERRRRQYRQQASAVAAAAAPPVLAPPASMLLDSHYYLKAPVALIDLSLGADTDVCDLYGCPYCGLAGWRSADETCHHIVCEHYPPCAQLMAACQEEMQRLSELQ